MQNKKNSITTKTGDDGYTDIIGGERLPKNHPIPECLGALDELNSFLGDAKAALTADSQTSEIINDIQIDLITIMGIVAGMPASKKSLGEERLDDLIKKLEEELPVLTSFTVPGINPVSAKLHITRAVCRRAERRLLSLGGETFAEIGPYLNRLSDILFLLAQKESRE